MIFVALDGLSQEFTCYKILSHIFAESGFKWFVKLF